MNQVSEFVFVRAKTTDQFVAARNLFVEYAEGLTIDLCFQNFEKELDEIPVQYNEPAGGLILIRHKHGYMGCAGIRKLEDTIAELKRMYIQPRYRGSGLGRILLGRAVDLARELGYSKIRLDTLRTMDAAVNLYRKSGFTGIDPYYFNPSPEVLYFEKEIQ